MKNNYVPKLNALLFFCLLICFSFNLSAQVGIGTTNPNPNALLDITSTAAAPGGLLLPRVALISSTNPAPLAGVVAGMAVYNTATVNDVSEGYYYSNGTTWIRLADDAVPSDDWTSKGNSGTTAGTNFLGTKDNVALRIKTNNADRFDFTNNGRLRSYNDGSATEPTYSWNAANGQAMGMYRIGSSRLGFSTASLVRLRLSNVEAVFNEGASDYDFRIESATQPNIFFVNAATNRIGIQTNSPAYSLEMVNSGNIGATSMAAFNNDGTDGVALLGINTSATNPYNGFEGAINYNLNTNLTAGIFGLSLAYSGDGIGVRGSSNSSNGYGVYGSIPTTGSWLGFGGLFLGGLGYVNGIYNLSDERAKKNITKITSALDNIMNIEGVSYNYDMKKFNPNAAEDTHKYYGFIAQNIKKYLPFAVAEKAVPFEDATTDAKSTSLSHSQILNVVDYTAIVPVLVEAMKEQQAQIKKLQEDIKLLKQKN